MRKPHEHLRWLVPGFEDALSSLLIFAQLFITTIC